LLFHYLILPVFNALRNRVINREPAAAGEKRLFPFLIFQSYWIS